MTGQWFIDTKTGRPYHFDADRMNKRTAEQWVATWASIHGPGRYIILGEDGYTPALPGMDEADAATFTARWEQD